MKLDENVCENCGGEPNKRIMDHRYKVDSANYKPVLCWVCRGRGKVLTDIGEQQLRDLLFYLMDYFPLHPDI